MDTNGFKFNRRFGDRLYFIRSVIGMNQDTFAEMIQVPYFRYQSIESGSFVNDFSNFVFIVDKVKVIFGIDVIDLISLSVDMNRLSTTVCESWNHYQNHQTSMDCLLLPEDFFQPVTVEQKEHLQLRSSGKTDTRLYVNVLLGTHIKFIRNILNIKQSVFAEQLCISEDRLSSLECGKTMRDFSIIIKILLRFNRFGITLNDLLDTDFDKAEIRERVLSSRENNRNNLPNTECDIIKIS